MQTEMNLPTATGHVRVTYRMMRDRADRIQSMIHDRAREVCRAAGLDPDLLGIHPHNALCGLESGHPWRGVDYSLVRKCKWLTDTVQWRASRLIDVWYARARELGRDRDIFDLK